MYRKKTVFCDFWYNPATSIDYIHQARSSGIIPSNKTYHINNNSHDTSASEYDNEMNEYSNKKSKNSKYIVDEEAERLKRLALLHKQKEEKMEIERQKRLQYIEEVILSFIVVYLFTYF